MYLPNDDAEPETQTCTTQYSRLEVPGGVHELQIKDVLPSDEQLELRFGHDDQQYRWVFLRIKYGRKWANALVSQLRVALGMTADEWRSSDYRVLIGRRVQVRIVHVIKGDHTFVNVDGFAPQAAEAAPQPVKAPKPVAAAAPPAGGGADDIPF